MTKVTPLPTNLVKFVTRFPGLTASGISQLMRKRSDWASGSLSKLVAKGRLVKRRQLGMRPADAWRYYPIGHRYAACSKCKELYKDIHKLHAELAQYKEILG